MKMNKLLSLMTVFAAGSLFAAAQPNVICLSFSTPGPDTYADGTTVADGECYALVWSADGAFDGINAKGEAVDANDRVLLMFAGKDGKLDDVTVQVSTELKFGETYAADGKFGIYLLDTRKYNGEGAFTVGAGNPVNKATVAIAEVAASTTELAVKTVADGAKQAADATVIPAEIQPPVIESFEIKADSVVLKVKGTSEFVNYAAQAADDLDGANAQTGAAKAGQAGEFYLIAPKPAGSTGFIKVIRK